jgi:hypothetical protein
VINLKPLEKNIENSGLIISSRGIIILTCFFRMEGSLFIFQNIKEPRPSGA